LILGTFTSQSNCYDIQEDHVREWGVLVEALVAHDLIFEEMIWVSSICMEGDLIKENKLLLDLIDNVPIDWRLFLGLPKENRCSLMSSASNLSSRVQRKLHSYCLH
jgi:hypothetical protein